MTMAPKITEPTEERTVKIKAFRYYLEQPDPIRPDQVITRVRLARSGDQVKLREVDAARGDAGGAFFTEEELRARAADGSETAEPDSAAPQVDLTQLDEGEIRAWLEGNREGTRKPSIPQVLSAVNAVEDEDDRSVVAEAVISAEQSSDHDTRSSLVEKLEAVTDDDDDDEE
jgi:hypothetical protein